MSERGTDIGRRTVLKSGVTALSVGVAGLATSSPVSGEDTVTVDASAESGYDSIGAALDSVAAGGTVDVTPGAYTEQIRIAKSVTLRGDTGDDSAGAGPDAPELDGNGTGGPAIFVAPGTADVTVEGFEIHDYGDESASVTGLGIVGTGRTDRVRLRDNDVYDVSGGGILKQRNNPEPATGWSVVRNHVRDFVVAGISIGNTSNLLIEDNRVEGTDRHSIRGDRYSHAGIKAPVKRINGGSKYVVENVTIRGNEVRGPFNGAGVVVNAWNANQRDAPVVCRNADVVDNVVTRTDVGEFSVGVNLLAYYGATVEDVTVRGNDVSESHRYCGLIQGRDGEDGTFTDVVWERNNLSGQVVGLGIFDTDGGPITVRENRIENNDAGVAVFDNGGTTEVDAITVTRNALAGNEKAGVRNFLETELNAERNWWGDTQGPTRQAGKSEQTIGDGDRAIGPVDYTPWLTKVPETGWN